MIVTPVQHGPDGRALSPGEAPLQLPGVGWEELHHEPEEQIAGV